MTYKTLIKHFFKSDCPMTYRVLFNNSNNQDLLRINYDKMKQNLTQSLPTDTIKTADDYIKHVDFLFLVLIT